MADSLLNKNKSTGKRDLLDRKESVKPKEVFDRSSLFTVDESKKMILYPVKKLLQKNKKGKPLLFVVQQTSHID
ncbi:hypothetical protein [Carnobacterium sp. TMP28]|uniref:hypothetical protein n=1 Tax=Carnobacterium sp. TMP28 TaxID=3397060 RepID=UPI0039E04BA2